MSIAGRLFAVAAAFAGLASSQISMGRPGFTPVPAPRKSVTAPVSSTAGQSATLTTDEQKRLTAVMNSMKPRDRKRFAKAVKRMTPEQKKQLIAALKQQLSRQSVRK